MVYRIYTEGSKGYQIECEVWNIDDLFIVLDMLIIDDNNSKVLVIEHNVEENYDFPMYLFTGNIMEYVIYRDNYYYNENKRLH